MLRHLILFPASPLTCTKTSANMSILLPRHFVWNFCKIYLFVNHFPSNKRIPDSQVRLEPNRDSTLGFTSPSTFRYITCALKRLKNIPWNTLELLFVMRCFVSFVLASFHLYFLQYRASLNSCDSHGPLFKYTASRL
jgi:hypothetical protein